MQSVWFSWFGITTTACVSISCFCLAAASNNYSAIEAEEALFHHLFERRYNKWIRPVDNANDRLHVFLKLTVRQLFGVDEKNQFMHTDVWLKKTWIDKNLQWKPEDFGNLTVIRVPAEWIWLPDIVLFENSDGNYSVSHMTRALLRYDGNVTWEPPATFRSWCNIDIKYFPFDVQNCSMKFASWTYSQNQLHLESWENEIDVSQLLNNGEWEIMDAMITTDDHQNFSSSNETAENVFAHHGLRYFIVMRRLPLFYSLFIIAPCVAISLLTGLVFYLPTASHEKITLCTSVLLAHTFYFMVITEITPSNSNAIPLIGEYLLFTMIFIVLSIIVTTIIISIHYRAFNTHRPLPSGLKTILQAIGPKLLCVNEFSRQMEKDKTFSAIKRASKLRKRLQNLEVNTQLSACFEEKCSPAVIQCVRFLLKRLEKDMEAQRVAEEWIYAAMILDRVMLIIFSCIFCAGTILLFVSSRVNYFYLFN